MPAGAPAGPIPPREPLLVHVPQAPSHHHHSAPALSPGPLEPQGQNLAIDLRADMAVHRTFVVHVGGRIVLKEGNIKEDRERDPKGSQEGMLTRLLYLSEIGERLSPVIITKKVSLKRFLKDPVKPGLSYKHFRY